MEKCMALNLNKFEFPLPKNTLCHNSLKLVEIGPAVLEKKIFKCFSFIFNLLLLSHLRKKDKVINLRETEAPEPKDVLCQV